MIPFVHDDPENKGIILEFDFETGMAIIVNMDDDTAQDFINIIQNKLNARI